MSLDSVELVVEMENYFKIQIPDIQAEKVGTVQDAVNTISSLLNISEENSSIKSKAFSKLNEAMIKCEITNTDLNYTDLVCEVIPNNQKQTWDLLADKLQLKIPYPPGERENSMSSRLLARLSWVPRFNYNDLTFDDLTNVICASNYKSLIGNNNITNKYEVYLAVMAITEDKTGVDLYEIKPEKSFTNDFGID